jgi:quinoprotein glucose dehydrogenase
LLATLGNCLAARKAGRGRIGASAALRALLLGLASVAQAAPATDGSWAFYGHDAGGQRFSPLSQVNAANVAGLKLAWTFHTGDIADGHDGPRSGLETTPLFIDGRLYLTTAFNRIIALDPTTGRQLWAYDPRIDTHTWYGDGLINRGVAAWRAPGRSRGVCSLRLFEATLDARLVAVDAATGRPCAGFGRDGEVSLRDVPGYQPGAYHMTSPPAVIDGLVVIGSAIDDNTKVEMPGGVVRGYDARTGALRWSWTPLAAAPGLRSGAANAWSIMTVDPKRHLVFVPTGSASPDYYGGLRPGDNKWADSVVALDSRTGRLVWGFQLVHHDLWDYDTASSPLLAEIPHDGKRMAVVVAANKTGFLYVLDRDTGRPVFPVEERAVPASDVPGEKASPTQPFSVGLPALAPQSLEPDQVFGLTPADREACRALVAGASGHSVFSPPSLKGVVATPGNIGGPNWSGFSFDPTRNLLLVNTNNMPALVRLVPPDQLEAAGGTAPMNRHGDVGPQHGAPLGMARGMLFAGPSDSPCAKPPWGELLAVDLAKGVIRWRSPLGTMAEVNPDLDHEGLGSISLGGAITTASGLTFIGGTVDRRFRAFDTNTGRQLWSADLPASAHATPMTYAVKGRQYVVIAAGGSAKITEERQGDAIMAFALPSR